jgi:hypothetical protein
VSDEHPIVSIRPPAPDMLPGAGRPEPLHAQPTGEQVHEPLHVQVFAAAVSSLSQQLDGYRPAPGRYGLVNAATALDLAAAALRVAGELATRQRGDHRDVPAPAELAALLHKVVALDRSVGDLLAQVQPQLARMFRAAAEQQLDAPPGSDPRVEVEHVMRSLINGERGRAGGTVAAEQAIDRLRRLRRPGDPPGR